MDNTLPATAPQTLVPEPRTLSEKLAALPLKPLLLLGLGAAALAAVAVALALRGGGSDYRVLFSGLSDKDGGAVISQLSQMGVPYKHSEGGGAILVPAGQVLDLRMKLSNLGLPRNSVVGYELLDTQKFGQTQAGEGMSMKRATEGELMRTIGSLSAVQQVRVHLALPQQNGFFREQQKPSASVMLTLHPGRSLDRAQLAGIVHLVSSSVPELSPKAVSVVDGSGTLLTGPSEGAEQGLDGHQLQYVQQVESGLQKRVMDLLEPVVGRENLRVTVTADIDFAESMVVSEEYKPNQGEGAAAIKSQQMLESNQPGPAVPSGVPGAQSNQPPVPATAPVNGPTAGLQGAQASTNGSTRKESTTAYEIDRTHRTTRNATGSIKRLSAAVVVNHRVATDARGRTTSTPLTPEELQKLTALVEQGVGLNRDRGLGSCRQCPLPRRPDRQAGGASPVEAALAAGHAARRRRAGRARLRGPADRADHDPSRTQDPDGPPACAAARLQPRHRGRRNAAAAGPEPFVRGRPGPAEPGAQPTPGRRARAGAAEPQRRGACAARDDESGAGLGLRTRRWRATTIGAWRMQPSC